jgi:hypothetical protein
MSKMSQIHADIMTGKDLEQEWMDQRESHIYKNRRINIAQIMRDPSTSYFFKMIYRNSLEYDLVDVCNDLEILLKVFTQEFSEMTKG